jgi:hypothetical protein
MRFLEKRQSGVLDSLLAATVDEAVANVKTSKETEATETCSRSA